MIDKLVYSYLVQYSDLASAGPQHVRTTVIDVEETITGKNYQHLILKVLDGNVNIIDIRLLSVGYNGSEEVPSYPVEMLPFVG